MPFSLNFIFIDTFGSVTKTNCLRDVAIPARDYP